MDSKVSLISESVSLWLTSPKMSAESVPSKRKILRRDLASYFGDPGWPSEKLSEIKPPLA